MMFSQPFVSVIIAAYESEKFIGGCLESLRGQTYKNFEVIVVNSSDETNTRREVQKAFPAARFIQHHQRLLPQDAKQIGINNALGDPMAFIDPDCRARPDWLEILVDECKKGGQYLGGSMENHCSSWLERGIHLCKFHDVLPGTTRGPIRIVPFSNVCMKRSAWEKFGPFVPDLYCSDAVLSWRAWMLGEPPLFLPNPVVEHIHGNRLFDFLAQRYFRGREFEIQRTVHHGWSRGKIAFRLALTPVKIFHVLFRSGKNARKSGKGHDFFSTLPIQILGQSAWIVGESSGNIQMLLKKDFFEDNR